MKNLLKIFKKDNTEEGLATYEELHDSHYNLNNEVGLINEKLIEHKDDIENDVKKLNNKLTNALGKIQKLSIEIKSLQEADKKILRGAKDVQQQMFYEYESFSEKMDKRLGNTNSEVHRLNQEIIKLKDMKKIKDYIHRLLLKTQLKDEEHIRRGHWRTYKSGKKVWIDACIGSNPVHR
jgi:chromosome segregation ATPase